MEGETLFKFEATCDDELSFEKGVTLKILNCVDDPYWYKAEYENRQGFVPAAYVDLKENRWYFGPISRANAECILGNEEQKYGAFLIRQSESCPGEFSLSVKFSHDAVQHFKILRDARTSDYYVWSTDKFSSLNELVRFYRMHSISRTKATILLKDADTENLARVVFDFDSSEPGELRLRKHDIVVVREKSNDDWWHGRLCAGQGLFPRAYVCDF